ncbi:MAG: regulatory protein RecX [Pseudomonadota bacterium]|nr:regulatory protein RecX [Pseudomonadota bacterium]
MNLRSPNKTPLDESGLYQKAIRLLAKREYAVGEIRRRLAPYAQSNGVLEATMGRLVDDGYLSDERFAEVFVRSHIERGDGPFKIRHQLAERGVSENTISRWLPDDETLWRRQLEKVRQKRFGEKPPADRRAWLKQARFLEQRGFGASQIRQVLGAPIWHVDVAD